MIRNLLFQTTYWVTSILFAITAMPLVLLPSRAPIMGWIRLYTKLMCFWMRILAGIHLEYKGRSHLPVGPCIIAAKHQSWGDGFAMFSQVPDLAFVTGDHLARMPLLGAILKKMGAIVVDNCGGTYARAKLIDEDLAIAQTENRKILIYPEGHLSKVGTHHRYRKGVFHIYQKWNKPVIPVATNLGLCWPEQSWKLTPGTAVVHFLDPIEPGLGKDEFMKRLQSMIEEHSLALLPSDFVIPSSESTEDHDSHEVQKTNAVHSG